VCVIAFVCVSVCGSVCGEGVRVQPYWEPPFVSDSSCMLMCHPCLPASLPLLTPVCYYTQRWLSDLQASWVHIAASTPGAAPPGNLSPLFESCLAVVRRCKTFGRPGFKQTVRNGILFADAEDDVRAYGSDCVCLCVDMRPCSLRERCN
jgi:hypothetical protein